jgi:molybdate transport system substrate-binding protein
MGSRQFVNGLPPRVRRLIFLAASVWGLSMGCGPASGAADGSLAGSTGELAVFAAVSLSEAFSEIATEFESRNPGVAVNLNLAGSQRLRTQLEHGARADVFASADQKQMNLAKASGVLANGIPGGKPAVFATNRLVVIVPVGQNNPRVTSIDDLAGKGIKLALALPDVPAGGYAREMISDLGVRETPPDLQLAEKIMANVVTLETNVRSVAAKVALGEVDAGVVYSTGAAADFVRGRVRVIPIPEASNVTAAYLIAALREARNPLLAEGFIFFVLSPKGQSILATHGFGPAAKP